MTIAILSLVLMLSPAASTPPPDAAAATLARISRLAGHWTGTYQWSGARTSGGAMDATYSTTGNGSAVVETLESGGKAMMTTVYHVDGSDLRMTHYCAAQNQPRLKARRTDLGQDTLTFEFVDATNLRSPQAPHVHGMTLQFVDDDHIVLRFRFTSGEKESIERIELTRSRSGA